MEILNYDNDWKFRLSNEAAQIVTLPHDWSIGQKRDPDVIDGHNTGYFPGGLGTYTKQFIADSKWADKKVFIEFEGVYMNSEVFLNGNLLGRHPYGYTGFIYDMSSYLIYGSENELIVTVDNNCQPNSRWYSGSGIYRHVWLRVANLVHVKPLGTYITTPVIEKDSAAVIIVSTVHNTSDADCHIKLNYSIFDLNDQLVCESESTIDIFQGGSREVESQFLIDTPKLWDINSPNLYKLISKLILGESVIDTSVTDFGIRSISVDSIKGFTLNGNLIKLKGGCIHHDNGIIGAASFDRAEERKVDLLKASGYNAVRCAHNPPAPAFLNACDRLGLLVIDESFDCWRIAKTRYDYHTVFEDWWQRDLISMLLRDRNHPSVIIWSIGNEIPEREGESDVYNTCSKLASLVRLIDDTRPVTSALCPGSEWGRTPEYFKSLDIGGYNYLYEKYEKDHELFPERIMAGLESFPYQAYDNWMMVIKHPYVIGDFVWTSIDYIGEVGIGRQVFEDDTPEVRNGLGKYP